MSTESRPVKRGKQLLTVRGRAAVHGSFYSMHDFLIGLAFIALVLVPAFIAHFGQAEPNDNDL